MNITFNWLPQIKPSLRAAAEMKLRNDIQESDDFKPCHTGPISVSILSSDPLEVSIKGIITCKCGKMVASFKWIERWVYSKLRVRRLITGRVFYFWPNFALQTDR